MTDQEKLNLCRFYKGEEEPPKCKDYDTFLRFWYLEKEYFFGCFDEPYRFLGKDYERGADYWENEGVKECREIEVLQRYTKTEQGFLAYADCMCVTHGNFGIDFEAYGKE